MSLAHWLFRLLLPALFAFTAGAPATAVEKKAPPAIKVLEYTHETVGYPDYWKTGPKTKDLIRAEFYYQWDKPGRTCDSDAFPWAYVTIANDLAPCWPPDRQFFKPVKKMYIDGFAAILYRRDDLASGSPEIVSPDSCPGQSNMVLNFTCANRCYTMKFLTSEKWLKRFFPDFTLIMKNFHIND